MSGIRGKNTRPELVIRKGLHAAGFRYRLHDRSLPGKPDLVLPRYRAVVMVNGCFWHMHDCHLFRWPSSRPEFWREKILRNVENDRRAADKLRVQGWRIATIWECALKGRTKLDHTEVMQALAVWLNSSDETITIRGSS